MLVEVSRENYLAKHKDVTELDIKADEGAEFSFSKATLQSMLEQAENDPAGIAKTRFLKLSFTSTGHIIIKIPDGAEDATRKT